MFIVYGIQNVLDDESKEHCEVILRIDMTELERLLLIYNPESGTSPGVTDCRPLTRAILDALKVA